MLFYFEDMHTITERLTHWRYCSTTAVEGGALKSLRWNHVYLFFWAYVRAMDLDSRAHAVFRSEVAHKLTVENAFFFSGVAWLYKVPFFFFLRRMCLAPSSTIFFFSKTEQT